MNTHFVFMVDRKNYLRDLKLLNILCIFYITKLQEISIFQILVS